MRRPLLIGLALAGTLAAFVYANNTSLLGGPRVGKPTLLAHRGLHQTFPADGLKGDTCTASRMHPPEHGYLENTIAAMQAAFDAGADVVELDIHPTTDRHFAVLHDWALDCRTNGTGETRKHTLAELKALDIGYGYTADGGETYPFRGKGVGLMPSLDEVLAAFQAKRLLIDIKSNDPADGETLAERLARLPDAQLSRIMVYGGDRPVETVRARLPALKTLSRASLKSCLLGYIGMGWSGYVPAACQGSPASRPHQCRALAVGLALPVSGAHGVGRCRGLRRWPVGRRILARHRRRRDVQAASPRLQRRDLDQSRRSHRAAGGLTPVGT